MSRRRDLREEAEKRWPTLYQFLGGYLHEDWPEMYGSPEGALDKAIEEWPADLRVHIFRELKDWHTKARKQDDIRSLLDRHFSVCVFFRKPSDGDQFVTMVRDKLLVSLRKDMGMKWDK